MRNEAATVDLKDLAREVSAFHRIEIGLRDFGWSRYSRDRLALKSGFLGRANI